MLNQDQVTFYRDNGYLVVPDVFPADEIVRLRAVAEEFQTRGALLEESDAVFDIGPGREPGTSVVRRVKDPTLHHEAFDAAMRKPELVALVSQLIGPGVRFDAAKLNFKPAGGGAPIDWHQDWCAYPHTNDDLLAVGVMLDDVTSENGPLMVIPGSHKGPAWSHHHEGRYVMAVDPEDFRADWPAPVELTGKAGSITIHHVRTLHASKDNTGANERRLLLFQYTAVDAWPLTLQPDWDEYNSRILTGEPTFHPRMEALPVCLPVPMPADTTIFIEQSRVKDRAYGVAAR